MMLAVVGGVGLTVCVHPSEIMAYAECGRSDREGNYCKGGAEGKWDFDASRLVQAMASTYQSTLSASDIVLDVGNSTVGLPGSGQVVVTLSEGDSVLAAQQFDWTRYGATLVFSNPGAVDAWAADYGSADRVAYGLVPFNVVAGVGLNTFAVTTKYQGQGMASASTTFCTLSKYPTPNLPMPCL